MSFWDRSGSQSKNNLGVEWAGFRKSYVILIVGYGKCLRPITRWVGGVKKGQKYAYVIFEWSPSKKMHFMLSSPNLNCIMPAYLVSLKVESLSEQLFKFLLSALVTVCLCMANTDVFTNLFHEFFLRIFFSLSSWKRKQIS